MAFAASKDLRYTRSCAQKILTPSQRYFYEKNGFLVIPRLISQDILDACSQRYDDIIAKKAPTNGMLVMYDVKDKKSAYKVQDLLYDDVFISYLKHPKLLDVVEAFVGSNILVVHSMLIAKPPDVGYNTTRHPPHQDLYYFPFRPADSIVAAWTAIERCDSENGCLQVIPGSHTIGDIFPHGYPSDTVNKFFYEIQEMPVAENWVYLEMNPGDTVFFHPLLIHASGINTSNRTRKSISGHYAAGECVYLDTIENTVHKAVGDDITEVVKKRFGLDITYTDMWRAKSMLVRGVRSTL